MKSLHDADPEATLLSYWLDELDEADAARVEEHLFECDECAARLREIVRLGAAIRQSLLDGRVTTAVTPAFVRRMKDAGLRLREYSPPAGGSVNCTISPQDDFVISHLRAPLEGVRQLDLEIDADGATRRVAHVPFDAASGEVTFIPPAAMLRTLGFATQRMRLFAVTPGAERLVAEYTFHHEPWGTRPTQT